MKLWLKNKRKWLIHVLKILKDLCKNSISMWMLSHGHLKVKYDTKTHPNPYYTYPPPTFRNGLVLLIFISAMRAIRILELRSGKYIYIYTPRNFNAWPTCTVWRNFLLPSLLWHFLAREENNSADTKLEDKNIVHALSAFEDKNRKIFAIFLLKFHCISTSIGCFLSTPILKSMLQLWRKS